MHFFLKFSPLPHRFAAFAAPTPFGTLESFKGTLRKDCLLRFVFHFDIRTVFLNVA